MLHLRRQRKRHDPVLRTSAISAAILIAAAGAARPASAQQLTFPRLYTLTEDTSRENGWSVSGAGDVNGDGFADFVVGARNGDFGRGSARVFSGADGSELYRFDGMLAGSTEISVSDAGDVNGDGFGDVVFGENQIRFEYGYYSYYPYITSTRRARVFSGADGSELLDFDNVGNPNREHDGFGRSVSGLGDVDGDGFDDVIVGGQYNNIYAFSGNALVYSGVDGGFLTSPSSTSQAFSVSGAGDVNGDGFADYMVGQPYNNRYFPRGNATVYSGSDDSVLFSFEAEDFNTSFGFSVSDAGDVDGDGLIDFIVGDPGNDENGNRSGAAHVFSGADGAELYKFTGDSTDDRFGFSVSGAGDVDGDGFADLLIGAPGDDPDSTSNTGSVYVYSGADGSLLARLTGDDTDPALREFGVGSFGRSVSGIGDVNGDGLDDFIIGAPYGDPSFDGQAVVFGGVQASNPLDFNGDGSIDISDLIGFINEFFGAQADPALDFNGDGSIDISDLVNYINDFFASP